jgi:hypothetical protein
VHLYRALEKKEGSMTPEVHQHQKPVRDPRSFILEKFGFVCVNKSLNWENSWENKQRRMDFFYDGSTAAYLTIYFERFPVKKRSIPWFWKKEWSKEKHETYFIDATSWEKLEKFLKLMFVTPERYESAHWN